MIGVITIHSVGDDVEEVTIETDFDFVVAVVVGQDVLEGLDFHTERVRG